MKKKMNKKINRLENIAYTLLFTGIIGVFGLGGRIEYDTQFCLNSLDFSFFACLVVTSVFLYAGYTMMKIIEEYKERK